MSGNRLIKRLERTLENLGPNSEAMRAAMTRIGIFVSSQTKMNIRRDRLIDTGRLINSIRYELYQEGTVSGVMVGSYGVPYAAVHEYGFKGVVNVRSHTRLMKTVFGRDVAAKEVTVRPHSRKMNIRAKYFLTRAIKTQSDRIIDILREAMFTDAA